MNTRLKHDDCFFLELWKLAKNQKGKFYYAKEESIGGGEVAVFIAASA